MSKLIGALLVVAVLSSVALAQVTPVQVQVKISPDTLNLKSNGKWITCIITLPEGYNAANANIASMRLAGTLTVQKVAAQKRVLIVKASHAQVVSYINGLGLTFPAQVTLSVTGTFNDSTPFQGQGTIRAIKPGGKKK